jgi:excisionase family DNA binding protein
MSAALKPSTPALALTVQEAAAALSVSYDTFHEQIEPELRIVRIGRRKLIPVAELERWLAENAERTL